MYEKIINDLTTALKQQNEQKIHTLRLIKNALDQERIRKNIKISEQEEIRVLQSEAKKRKEAIQHYKNGSREDLASQEEIELKIIQAYLPKGMSDAEYEKIIDEIITHVGAKDKSDFGKVMGQVMKKLGGVADGAKVSSIVRKKLGA